MSDTTYSFSRLTMNCKFNWHRKYNKGEKGTGNGFSDGGTFCHDLMERVAKKEITESEAFDLFKDNWFDAIQNPYPRMGKTVLETYYYDKVQPFFNRKSYWKGEVISVEEHLEFTLPNGRKFQGFVDLSLLSGKETILVDYKISKPFTKKQLIEKQRQLLIYAEGWRQKTGKFPDIVAFMFFQDVSATKVIEVTQKLVDEALEWAMEKIIIIEKLQLLSGNEQNKKLRFTGIWIPDFKQIETKKGERDFYCAHLCDFNNNCKFVSGKEFVNKNILDTLDP